MKQGLRYKNSTISLTFVVILAFVAVACNSYSLQTERSYESVRGDALTVKIENEINAAAVEETGAEETKAAAEAEAETKAEAEAETKAEAEAETKAEAEAESESESAEEAATADEVVKMDRTTPIQDEIDTRAFLSSKAYKLGISDKYKDIITGYEPLDEKDFSFVRGGIIPHHNIANIFIADFYQMVAKISKDVNPYDLIIIISPNHYSIGPRFQIVGDDYYTYDGIVESDMDLVSRLLYYDDMNRASREMIDNEHGQLVHMPYIEHYFPDTKVLSIVIKELRDDEGITRAVEEIYSEVKDFNILFIASIDFSHYLSLESANEKDEFTRDYLTNNNTYTMMHLSNDYIDSPSTYKMFIEFLNRQNETKTLITNHSNSAIIMEDVRMTETTSYFQVIFDEKSY